jgi:hypothetical protein
VGIKVFAGRFISDLNILIYSPLHSLVSAFLCSRGVIARLLAVGEGAVILSITVGGIGIIWVVARIPQLRVLLRPLPRGLSRREGWEELLFLLDLGLG